MKSKILIVDDDKIVLDSCKRVLEPEGFDITLVSSAPKAIELLGGDHYQLLLIDLKMPENDGMWLIREVKRLNIEIPVIVMSGYSTNETIDDVINLGAVTFVPKPFTPDELLKSVQKVIY